MVGVRVVFVMYVIVDCMILLCVMFVWVLVVLGNH